jgi:hypothetical protein
MTRKWIFPALSILAVFLAVGFVACSDDDDDGGDSSVSAEAQLCADLAGLETALDDLQAINETNTVDELQAAQDDVKQAVDDVKSSAVDVADARVDDVDGAYTTLDEVVTGVEGDQTIADIQAELQDAIVDVITARDGLNNSLTAGYRQS